MYVLVQSVPQEETSCNWRYFAYFCPQNAWIEPKRRVNWTKTTLLPAVLQQIELLLPQIEPIFRMILSIFAPNWTKRITKRTKFNSIVSLARKIEQNLLQILACGTCGKCYSRCQRGTQKSCVGDSATPQRAQIENRIWTRSAWW